MDANIKVAEIDNEKITGVSLLEIYNYETNPKIKIIEEENSLLFPVYSYIKKDEYHEGNECRCDFGVRDQLAIYSAIYDTDCADDVLCGDYR